MMLGISYSNNIIALILISTRLFAAPVLQNIARLASTNADIKPDGEFFRL